MVRDQRYPVFFTAGIDSNTDEKLVMHPRLIRLENGVFSTGEGRDHGSISKRHGYTSLGTSEAVSSSVASSIDPVTSSYTVGGTCNSVFGTVTLRNTINGAVIDDLSLSSTGSFMFGTPMGPGATYSITALSTGSVSQSVDIVNPSGTIGTSSVTDVVVDCTASYFVGGTVIGLSSSMVIAISGTSIREQHTILADGTYRSIQGFQVGETYDVNIITQPTAQSGTVSNHTGIVPAANVTDANITLPDIRYAVGGTVTQLSGSGMFLRLVGEGVTEDLEVTGTAPVPFQFSKTLKSGSSYNISIAQSGSVTTSSSSMDFDCLRAVEITGSDAHNFTTNMLGSMWFKHHKLANAQDFEYIASMFEHGNIANWKFVVRTNFNGQHLDGDLLPKYINLAVNGSPDGGSVSLYLIGTGSGETEIPGLAARDTWHNLMWRYDGTKAVKEERLELWWDGLKHVTGSGILSASYSAVIPEVLTDLTGNVVMGDINVGLGSLTNTAFRGRIDDVTFWTGSFTDAQVQSIYNSGRCYDYTTHDLASQLVSWYGFNDEPWPIVLDRAGSNNGNVIRSLSPNGTVRDTRESSDLETYVISNAQGVMTTSDVTNIGVVGTSTTQLTCSLIGEDLADAGSGSLTMDVCYAEGGSPITQSLEMSHTGTYAWADRVPLGVPLFFSASNVPSTVILSIINSGSATTGSISGIPLYGDARSLLCSSSWYFWSNDYSGHWSTTARFDCGNMSGSDLPSGSQELTVGLWFKTKDIGSAKRTLWSWGSTMHTRLTGSNLVCQFPKAGGTANIVFEDVWENDTWHHLVMAYSGANVITNDRVAFYMDGVRLDASWDADPTGSLGEWSNEFRIGSHYAGTAYNFDDGNLDELTIWDSYARHILLSTGSSDVASMTGSEGSPRDPTLSNLGTPIHQWRWDTYTGESLEDVFGDNHGTLVSSGVSRSLDTP